MGTQQHSSSAALVGTIASFSAAAAGIFFTWRYVQESRRTVQQLTSKLESVQVALEKEKVNRQADRTGRTRAERELRKVQMQLQQLAPPLLPPASSSEPAPAGSSSGPEGTVPSATADRSAAGPPSSSSSSNGVGASGGLPVYPVRPIGFIRSCFSTRNGTPRQPELVPAARCYIQLVSDINADSLQGLEQYSHCWVLYVFHQNTDIARCFQPSRKTMKSKIHVPRLNGGLMGVFATRSPHRPTPIGLSTAQIIRVEGNRLVLGGADIVDGSPVLDIKPYVPFCDNLGGARSPQWVQAEADNEPLRINAVHFAEGAQRQLHGCWRKLKNKSVFASAEEFEALIQQVLCRDIRTVHQRINIGPTLQANGVGHYHVVLDGVVVNYDIDSQGVVTVVGGEVDRGQPGDRPEDPPLVPLEEGEGKKQGAGEGEGGGKSGVDSV